MDRVILKAIGSGFIALILILLIYIGIGLWRVAKKAGKKSVEIGKLALDQTKDHIKGIPDSGVRYDDLYTKAYEEMNSERFDSASWAKALANAAGEQGKAKALYIKYRVEQLKHE
ncbi:MAG: hypothetical protein ABIL62_13075 [Planctomycetota bacterium]